MNKEEWFVLEEKATGWILEAGALLKQSLTASLDVQYKSSHNDLVTNMDKTIEQFFVNRIKSAYPDHRIISEEGFGDQIASADGIIWLVDPIDGTMNFVIQKRHFAISIGIYENGEGRAAFIYDVMNDDLYHCIAGNGAFLNKRRLLPLREVQKEDALLGLNVTWVQKNRRIDPSIMAAVAHKIRGTRAYGSAAIELAYVASGLLDGYFTMRLSPWDFGAGLILIKEVGGVITRADGLPIDIIRKNSVLAGKKGFHDELVAHIQEQLSQGKLFENPDGC